MRELPSPFMTIRSDPECRSFPRLPWVARQQQRGKGGSHGQANETGCARCGAGGPRRGAHARHRGCRDRSAGLRTAPRIRCSRQATRRVRPGRPTRAARRSTGATSSGYNDGRISITRRGVVNGIDSIDWDLVDHTVDVDGRHRQGRRRRVHLLLQHRRAPGRIRGSHRRSTVATRRRRSATRSSASTRRTRRTRSSRSRSPRAARPRSRTAGRSTSRSSRPARPTRRTATTPC